MIAIGSDDFERNVGRGVVGPRVSRRVQAIAGIVARHVELDLTYLEDIDLHPAVGSGKQDSRGLDRLGAVSSAQQLEVRYLAEESIDHIEVNCGAIRIRQPRQDGNASDDHRWLPEQCSDLDHSLHDGGHRVTDEGDAVTRHDSTLRPVSNCQGSLDHGRRPGPGRARRTAGAPAATP